MAAAQLNVDTELKGMVLSFRVSELQVLLGHAGRNKSGRKHELMSRALHLIQTGCNKSIQTVIHDLYGKRYSSPNNNSHSNTRESSKSSAIVSEEYPKSHPKSPPQKLSVQLKPLAFYSHISDVLPPSLVSSSKHKIAHTSHHQLRLTHHQTDILCKGKIQGLGHSMIQKCPKNHTQIQLRFCKMDTSGDQPDCFPPNVSVKINSVMVVLPNFIPPTKAGVSPRRPNIPVDVTKMFFRSPCSQNTMEVRYSDHNTDFPTKYCVAVSVVEQLFADDLLQGLKSNAVQSANTTKLKIIDKLKKDLDSDVSTTNLKLSLLCPLGKMRMSTPVRGIKCTHLQCFDAMLYLRMNERKPTWLCPVCDKPADYDSLVIDGLFIEILDECKTEEIDFTSDGDWHASKKHTETLVIGTPIKPIDLVTAAKWNRNIRIRIFERHIDDPSASEERKKKEKQQEKLALDLSQNARVSRTVEKKKQPDVIDLTGDSSDDDDDSRIEIHSSNHNSGSETVADDATMSISSSPADVGSPSVAPRLLDVPLSKYSRTSPRREYRHTSPRSRSPYYRTQSRNSPIIDSKYNIPTVSPRRPTPPHHNPHIQHPSPIHRANGPVMTPPLPIPSPLVPPLPVPSPLVSGASPTTNSWLRSNLSGDRGLGLSGFSTPPLSSLVGSLNDTSLNMGFPDYAAFDSLRNLTYRHSPYPFFIPPNLGGGITPYDIFSRASAHPSAAPERSRTEYRDDDYPIDIIPIE